MTVYLATLSAGRVSDAGVDVTGEGQLSDASLFGVVENVSMPEVILPLRREPGRVSTQTPVWTRKINLGDFSFDIVTISENPETLGPGDIFMDLVETWTDGRIKHHRFGFILDRPGPGNFQSEQSFTRTITAAAFLRIDGGLDANNNFTDLSLEAAGANSGAGLYVDLRDPGIYRRREANRGNVIDEMADIRTAAGV